MYTISMYCIYIYIHTYVTSELANPPGSRPTHPNIRRLLRERNAQALRAACLYCLVLARLGVLSLRLTQATLPKPPGVPGG